MDEACYFSQAAQTLSEHNQHRFPLEHFYAFGWSGQLCRHKRKEASEELQEAINAIVETYTAQRGTPPHITLITHSHGGNVALNLAKSPQSFEIEILILLACPVQEETAPLVTSDLFKKIYSLHSHSDASQVLDPQGLHPFRDAVREAWANKSLRPLFRRRAERPPLFSQRHFDSTDPKLKQICLSWDETHPWDEDDIDLWPEFKTTLGWATWLLPSRRGVTHLEFLLPSFIKRLPGIISEETRNTGDDGEAQDIATLTV